MAKSRSFRASLAGTLLALATLTSVRPDRNERCDDNEVYVPGVGSIPRELYDLGIATIENPEVGREVANLYFLRENIKRGALASKSEIHLQIALQAQDAYVASMDSTKPTYSPDNIWETPEESRKTFLGQMEEILDRPSFRDYTKLPESIKKMVKDAGQMVYNARKIAGNTKETEGQ